MFHTTNAKFSTPDAVAAPQNMILTPLCLTVETGCLRFIAILALLQTLAFCHFQKNLVGLYE